MEYLKLAGIVIGASGFWEALKYLMQYRIQKKFKKAEIRNLNAQADEKLVGNWIAWSEKMEERVDDLEKNNKEMKAIITRQRERINELEQYIDDLEEKLTNYENSK